MCRNSFDSPGDVVRFVLALSCTQRTTSNQTSKAHSNARWFSRAMLAVQQNYVAYRLNGTCYASTVTPLAFGDCECYTPVSDRYSGVQFRSFTRPHTSLDKSAVRSSASGLSRSVRNLLARSLPCSVSNLRCDGSLLSLDS